MCISVLLYIWDIICFTLFMTLLVEILVVVTLKYPPPCFTFAIIIESLCHISKKVLPLNYGHVANAKGGNVGCQRKDQGSCCSDRHEKKIDMKDAVNDDDEGDHDDTII